VIRPDAGSTPARLRAFPIGTTVAELSLANERRLDMYARIGIAALAMGAVAMLGCERKERVNKEGEREVQVSPARPAEPSPARPEKSVKKSVSSASAVSSIVEARCDRESRCENMGANKKYKSWQQCKQEIATKSNDKIGAPECPGGIDSHELSECLTEIRNEGCGNPLDTLERVAACNSADLCIDKP
jgi:Family of unknown function (DUF6184)